MVGTAGVINANSEKQCTIPKNSKCTQVDFEWTGYTMNVDKMWEGGLELEHE